MARILLTTLALLLSLALAQAPDAIGSLYTRDMGGDLNFTCTISYVQHNPLDAFGDITRDEDGDPAEATDATWQQEPFLLTAAHCVDRGLKRADTAISDDFDVSTFQDGLYFDEDADAWRTTRDYLVTFDETSYYEVHLAVVGDPDAGYDAAVLRFVDHEPEADPIRLGIWDDVQVGSRITNYANPAGLGLQRFEGYVTMLSLNRRVESGSINWRGNAVAILPSAGGSSGSLILNEHDEVVGVLVGGIHPNNGSSFTVWVPLWKLHEMANDDSKGRIIAY